MQQQGLRRDLGLPQAMLTVVGIVIGSGIFALPAVVLTKAQTPGLSLLAWVIGGLISLAAGLTIAELTAAMPKAGGTYVFLNQAYGEWLGFLQGWAFFLAYNSATNAGVAMMFTTYLTALVPLSTVAQTAVGLLTLAGLTAINILGVRFGGWLQVVSTVGKLVPIALLILFGLGRIHMGNLGPLLPASGLGGALAGALLPVLWAYDGWINVGMLAEEIKDPQRNLPLAFIGGLAAVTAIYALFNAALLGVLGPAHMAGLEKPAVSLAVDLFGGGGATLMTVGMLVSMFGTLNACVMTAPRYYLAMARDGLFPAAKTVSALHPKFGTPVTALLLSFGWSSVLLLSGKFGQLLNLVVFVAWVFNTLAMAAVLVLRKKRPDLPRPYRAWGYPVVPLVGIAAGLWIVGSMLVTEPMTAMLGLGLTMSGLPVFWMLRRKG